ncbi:MAG: hypothetical protein ACREEM_11290 [Blastocatellia bacterium]
MARFDPAQNKFVAAPIDLGPDLGNASDQVFLIVFGTGFRNRSGLSAVTAQIGGPSGVDAQVTFAGPQGAFAGLDQANARLPRSLIGRGEVDVVFMDMNRLSRSVAAILSAVICCAMCAIAATAQTQKQDSEQTIKNRAKQTFRDERVKAAIAMAPQIGSAAGMSGTAPSPLDQLLSAGAWDEIRAPVMVFIGTRDTGYGLLQKNPNLRRLVYDTMPAGGKYLANLVNGQHHAFTDTVPWYGGDERIPAHYGYIQQVTTAFWDAYLKGNQTALTARAWLDHNTLQKATNGQILQENKHASAHSGAQLTNSPKPRAQIKPRATVRGAGATLDFYPLTKFIQSGVKERRLPGAAMLVVNRYGEVFYKKSFGQFLPDTAVPIGATKGWLSAAQISPGSLAANSVVSARDLGKLTIAMLNDGEYEGKRLAPADSARQIKAQSQDQFAASESSLGSTAWLDLKHEIGAVFLTHSQAVDFHDELQRLVRAIIEGKPETIAELTKPKLAAQSTTLQENRPAANARTQRSDKLAPGLHSLKVISSGKPRGYELFVPSSYEQRGSLPIVIMLHSGGSNGKKALEQTKWDVTAEREGFLAAFPDGGWNDGSGRGGDNDDVAFMRDLIEDLSLRFELDRGRVYLTGLMIGASMAFRAGYELSDRIAAIAPVTGHFMLENPQRLASPVSLICFWGTHDMANPMMEDLTRISGGTGIRKPEVRDSVYKWAEVLGAALPFDSQVPPRRLSEGDPRSEPARRRSCPPHRPRPGKPMANERDAARRRRFGKSQR